MIWPGNPVGYFRQDRRHAFVRSQEIVEPVARVITSGWRAGHFIPGAPGIHPKCVCVDNP